MIIFEPVSNMAYGSIHAQTDRQTDGVCDSFYELLQ